MPANPVNQFLPTAGGRQPCDEAGEDDFDVTRGFNDIKKAKKEELERVESQFNNTYSAIENRIRAEQDQLFQQFQSSMQHLYTNLTKTVNVTIENQVLARLEQERLRRDHDAKLSEVDSKYHDIASQLITSTNAISHGARQPKSFVKLPSQGLVPSHGPIPNQGPQPSQDPSSSHAQGYLPSRGGFQNRASISNGARSSNSTATNGAQYISPAPSSRSLNRAPSFHRRVPLNSDDMTRERVLQQPPRPGHSAQQQLPTPLPTPEELLPHQRRPVPSEPRRADPRHVEHRYAEPRNIEPRPAEPRAPSHHRTDSRSIESRPVKPSYNEPRAVERLSNEQHPVEQRRVTSLPVDQRSVEQDPVEPGSVAQRPVAQRAEQRQAEQRQAEQRQAEQRPVEPLPAEQPPIEQVPAPVDHLPVAHRSVEQIPAEKGPAQQAHVEPRAVQPTGVPSIAEKATSTEQIQPTASGSHEIARRLSDMQTTRQETKRKVGESTTSEQAPAVPLSKRPRLGDKPPKDGPETQSPMTQSPPGRNQITRTIPFEEVYQDGKAQFKHKIFMWPKDSGDWYIVRCDEHQVHFNIANPKHGAAKHVHSPQHGGLEKKHDLAMHICGHLVLGCTAELAELNNREFQRAIDQDNYQVFNMNLLTKEGKRRLTDTPAKPTETTAKNTATGPSKTSVPVKKKATLPAKLSGGVSHPEECKFYLGWWGPTKKHYMLVVLPIRPDGSLQEVGLRQRLQETELMGNVPKCYSTDRLSLQIKGFQSAYTDDGAKADKREYPVMFFDSPVQKHSVAWLHGSKLTPVDLTKPPVTADKKQVAMARDWYATRMMHRRDWEQFKQLGPGEIPSPTLSEGGLGRSEQWVSLRSTRADEMSPIRDRSNGPVHFFGSGSSDAESSDMDDAEDFMKMDIGPVPEPTDSNYVDEESESDNSDVEMRDAIQPEASDVNNVIRLGERRSSAARPGSRHGRVHAREMSEDEDAAQAASTSISKEDAPQMNKADNINAVDSHHLSKADLSKSKAARPDPPTPPAENYQQREITVASEQDQLRNSVQAKAVAAMKEADSRSRASSEIPEVFSNTPTHPGQQNSQNGQGQAGTTILSRPPFADLVRSRSEDTLTHAGQLIATSPETSQLNGAHKQANPTNMSTTDPDMSIEGHVDPYEKAAAIRAERCKDQLSRAASAPVHEGDKAALPFGPLPSSAGNEDVARNAVQHTSPSASLTMSPPLSQSSRITPARSLSTTPTQGSGSGRNTPKIVIPDSTKWKAVRTRGGVSLQEPSAPTGTSSDQTMAAPEQRDTQLGTPIHDKVESFDVSQFEDSEGDSWIRAGSTTPFLRLVTDPMRKWAETEKDSPLKANIEPAQIERIETNDPGGNRGKQRVQLTTKVGRTVALMFETNTANGRSQGAALQGRKFVSWVKKINESVDWVDNTGSRPGTRGESHFEEQSVTVK